MATQTLAIQNGSIFTPRASQSAPAASKPQERTRQYKDYLTPLLHRRFTSAASLALGWCWIVGHACGSESWWWIWLPTPSQISRTLLMVLPCLAVFIVRVANIHVGERNASSQAEAFLLQLAGPKSISSSIQTLGWYVWSAWFFGEVYIWSKGHEHNLGWIDPGQPYERPKVNENPVFLRCLFLILGVLQTINHLGFDYDRVAIRSEEDIQTRLSSTNAVATTGSAMDIVSRLPRPLRMLVQQAGKLANRCGLLACVGLVFCMPALYWSIMRRPAWALTYTIARVFYSQLPPSAEPTGLLDNGLSLIWQSLSASCCLASLWQVSNAAFDIFAAEPPLKKDQPLTNEIKDARGAILHQSKDPNGSLITGLKSKREIPSAFAFWELYLICTKFSDRRTTIYTEFDREGGGANSTWRQICDRCIAETSKLTTRIKSVDAETGLPLPKPAIPPYTAETAPGLPKIAAQIVKTDTDVVLKPKQDLTHRVSSLARAIGQSAPSQRADLSQTLRPAADRVLPTGRKVVNERIGQFNATVLTLLQMPLSEPLRQTFSLRVQAIVFGKPYSNRVTCIHAIKALTKLTTCSLTEARFGGVAQDVPRIIRTFTDAIQVIEKFLKSLAPHWTDVLFTDSERDVAEVLEVVHALKEGLESVLLAFGEYAEDLGLSKMEVRQAKGICERKEKKKKSLESGPAAASTGRRKGGSSVPEMAQINR